ncbi:MAG TPA: hypothetical protein VG318_15760, partial [Actinomycetota bacterium]|nr:hypothetical protein [Actinomycetota bacterium]
MEGTATHELGHVYGLKHAVADGAPLSEHTLHADLTMHGFAPGSFRKCQTRYRTLGKGDILGLEAKY